jgi:hypothetical protein
MKVRTLIAAGALALIAVPGIAQASPVPSLTMAKARTSTNALLQKIAVRESQSGFGVSGSYISGCYRISRVKIACGHTMNFADGTHCVGVVSVWNARGSTSDWFWTRSSNKSTYCGY